MIEVGNQTIYTEFEQGSDEWHEIRRGKIGGTSCATILVNGRGAKKLGAGAQTMVYKKAAEFYTEPDDVYVNAAMQRGTELEPLARKRYEDETFQNVVEVGYISRNEFLGVSPDGLVGENGGVEIKCPGAAEFLRFMDTQVIKKEYFYQCQWAMYLTGREWWDFIYFHPDFEPADLIIQRQTPDEKTFAIWDEKLPIYTEEITRVLNKVAEKKND